VRNIKLYEYNNDIEEYEEVCFITILELITSRDFIQAIRKYINNLNQKNKTYKILTIDYFTLEQARAIRDNKLDDFINLIK